MSIVISKLGNWITCVLYSVHVSLHSEDFAMVQLLTYSQYFLGFLAAPLLAAVSLFCNDSKRWMYKDSE